MADAPNLADWLQGWGSVAAALAALPGIVAFYWQMQDRRTRRHPPPPELRAALLAALPLVEKVLLAPMSREEERAELKPLRDEVRRLAFLTPRESGVRAHALLVSAHLTSIYVHAFPEHADHLSPTEQAVEVVEQRQAAKEAQEAIHGALRRIEQHS